MSETRPIGEQLRFASSKTGSHILDAYLEAAERGNRTLSDLLSDLWDPTTGAFRSNLIQFRVTSDGVFQQRIGDFVDPNAGWVPVIDALIFRQRGPYASGTAYARLDIVTHLGDAFICDVNHTSSTPNPSASFRLLITGGGVSPGRAINTSGLATGGGDLSANRTINVPASTSLQGTTGTDTATAMTPASTRAAIDARVPQIVTNPPAASETVPGIVELATAAEVATGTDTTRAPHAAATLSAINTRISAVYTASDVLSKLLTVDGPGSGLDADFLDGISSAGFASSSTTVSAGTGLSGGGNLTANRTLTFDTTWGDARYARPGTSPDFTGLTVNANNVFHAGNFNPNSKADLAGLGTQTFSVADATTGLHAVNRQTGDGRYALATGTSSASFTINGNTAWHAGNFNPVSKLDTTGGTLTGNLTVPNATNDTHALNRGTANSLYATPASVTAAVAPKADIAGQTFTGAIGATALTISSTGPQITMADTNGISRSILADANLIGFLLSNGNWASYTDNSGNFVAVGNVTAFSDPRLKTDLVQISDALDKVAHLTGYTYERIDTGERQVGLLSTDVEAVVPEAVQKGREYDAVNYGGLVGLLVEAIKELTARVEKLEAGHGRHGP